MQNLLKSISLSAIVLMTGGLAKNASAHQIVNSLNPAASATDWFTINCPGGTAEFYAYILDTSSADGVFFKVTISKTGALSSTDKPDGGAPSPGVSLVNGSSIYNIFVTHSGATVGFKTYTLNYFCQTASHQITATTPNPITKQDQ